MIKSEIVLIVNFLNEFTRTTRIKKAKKKEDRKLEIPENINKKKSKEPRVKWFKHLCETSQLVKP